MVAPWLSWSTVFCTAAGRSERFSRFSFSCDGVCCVAACDATAHVSNRAGIVHFVNRMKSSWRVYGANSTWPYLTAGLQAIVSGINTTLHTRVELGGLYPPCPPLRSRMNKPSIQVFALLVGVTLAWPGASSAQAFKVAKYSIGGDGGTDYLTAEPGTGRVFVSRSTHVMVIDGATGKVIGDIPDTPRNHGIALAPKSGHGFITSAGDSTVTMFDLGSLAVIKKIPVPTGGLDGIMYDDFSDRIILTNHSRPAGTLVAIDPKSGAIVATVQLEDTGPEGAASDGKGKIFVNNEGTSTMQVIDEATMKAVASWPLAPCDGPTGIAYDRATDRILSGCGKSSVVVDARTGKVVATIANGDGVDALGWDPAQKLIYIPAGRDSNVTVVRQDGPDKYTVVATVPTMRGAKTISVDAQKHVAYLFQPEYGPPPAGTPPPQPGQGPVRGPVIGAYFFAITH